jgi:hypothetical protein
MNGFQKCRNFGKIIDIWLGTSIGGCLGPLVGVVTVDIEYLLISILYASTIVIHYVLYLVHQISTHGALSSLNTNHITSCQLTVSQDFCL